MDSRPLWMLLGFVVCCGVPALLVFAAFIVSGRISRIENIEKDGVLMKGKKVFWLVVLAFFVGWLVNETEMLPKWQTAVYSLSAPSPARVEPVRAERIDLNNTTFIGGVNEMRLTVTPVPVVGDEMQGGTMPNERHEKKERPAVTERSD